MKFKSVKLLLLGLFLSVTNIANATLITYDITVTGGWFDTSGNPYDMPFSPTLTGTITVDNILNSLVDFSLTTGTKTWDETEIDPGEISLSFGLGELINFSLSDFNSGPGFMYIYSSNTMGVFNGAGVYNACNNCVSFERSQNPPVPAPEPSTLAVFALGLLGLASRRFKK